MNQHAALRTLMTFDDELDDIKRARIWSALEDKLLDDVAAPARRRRWPFVAAAAIAVAAATLLLLADRDDARTLAVPADTQVTAQLGPYTHAALVGPAQLDFVGASGNATTVRMRAGTLLAEFEGGTGRSLRIETRGAIVEVVGTLFAVRVDDAVTCTSVAHGRVRVTTPSAVTYVAAGERFCTNDTATRAIEPSMRESLDSHRKVITASAPTVEPIEPAPSPPDVVANSKPDVTMTSKPDVATTSKPDVATTSKPDVATASKPGVATASKPDVATTSKPDVATTSKPDVATTSKPDLTTTSQGDARSKPTTRALSTSARATASAPVPEPVPVPVPVPETAAATSQPRAPTSAPVPVPETAAATSQPRAPTTAASSHVPATSTTRATSTATSTTPATSQAPASSTPSTSATQATSTTRATAQAPASSTPSTSQPRPPSPEALDTSATVDNPGTAKPATPKPATIDKPATADELYRRAESALASRDAKTADRMLASLLAQFPTSPLADQALYDRARIAYQQRAWRTARQHLDKLAALSHSRLAEPGHYLRCRIAVEAKDAASACFLDYRKRFPRAPHDLDALAVLAREAHARGGCDAARVFVDELLSAYPRTTVAASWRERCEAKP